MKVAIIGAGPSGMAQLRAFETLRKKGGEIPEIVCYEKQESWGGMWNYEWRTGLDQYGEPLCASMYRYLWTNGPKECLEFSDYTFEEHFGYPIPSYPPRAVLRDYIGGRLEKDDVAKYMKFLHAVHDVKFDDATQKFTLKVRDLKNNCYIYDEADYVVVAAGHFSTPNVPYFEGIEKFKGRVTHAHDFRSADEYKGLDILVVGSSYSAEDIGIQCYKYGAKSITYSYRTAPMDFDWPENFEEVPLLTKVVGDVAHFKNGYSKKIDAIVLCTGYQHYTPFLPDDLTIKESNRLWLKKLYKGVVWIDNPKLMYLGAQDQYYTFNMFDAQAWFARDVMMGTYKLPSAEEMTADNEKWRQRFEKLDGPNDEIDFQRDYVRDLIDMTDYPEFSVEKVADLFKAWKHDKHEGILTYRDRSYISVLTGKQAPPHHTPWMKALDDTLEAFLRIGISEEA